MGQLQDQMRAALLLRGFRPNTCETYLRCARVFVRHYRKSPREMGKAEVHEYLLHLLNERGVKASTFNVHAASLKFLYDCTMGRPGEVAGIRWMRARTPLPVVLTGEEVERLLRALGSLKMQAIVMIAYGAGLRVSEVCHLQVQDIDSKRMMIRVRDGKGGRDRYTILPQRALQTLRAYWKQVKLVGPNLFPGMLPGTTLTRDAVARALQIAAKKARIRKRVTPHGLRHAFATELLGQGTHLRTLQVLLGHSSIRSTVRYTHVTPALIRRTKSPVDRLAKVPPLKATPRSVIRKTAA